MYCSCYISFLSLSLFGVAAYERINRFVAPFGQMGEIGQTE